MWEPRISRLPRCARAAATGRADCPPHRRAQSCPGFHARAQMRMNLVNRRREKAARDAARLFAHGGDAPALGDGALRARLSCAHQLSAARLADEFVPRMKIRSPRSQVSSTRPRSSAPRYGESLWRKCRSSGATVQLRRDRRRRSPRPRQQPALLFVLLSPASRAGAAAIHLRRCASQCPSRVAASPVHSTGSARPRLAMPPQARSQRPSSRRFIAGGQGEWSVVTISISPASSAAHSASRLAAPRMGGAHLNSVAPSGISSAANQR